MALTTLQIGLTTETAVLFALAMVGFSALVFYDARRRDAPVPAIWAIATAFGVWTTFGLPIVLVAYYVVVVRDGG